MSFASFPAAKSLSYGQEQAMAKLRHIAITVPDPEKAAEFYMRAFGLERVGQTDWAGARGV
jgi:predicted enzyme related to lactoylglutathione lyase